MLKKDLTLKESIGIPKSFEDAVEDDDILELILEEKWEKLCQTFEYFGDMDNYKSIKVLALLTAHIFNMQDSLSESLGNYLSTIPENWFSKLHITKIIVPKSIVGIEKDAFFDCNDLKEVVLPDGLLFIGLRAFADCINLSSITIPDSVTQIDGGAFSSCANLTSVTLPKGLDKLSNSLFSNCSKLQEITLPDSLKVIESSAFSVCDRLEYINIPEGVKEICSAAFFRCNSLYSVKLPSTIQDIGNGAFSWCPYLKSITFNGTMETWRARFKRLMGTGSFFKSPMNTVKCIDGTIEYNITNWYK